MDEHPEETRNVRHQFRTTPSLAERLEPVKERGEFTDLLNRLLRSHFDAKDHDSEIMEVRAERERLENAVEPTLKRIEELYAKEASLQNQQRLEEFEQDQEQAWRRVVREDIRRRQPSEADPRRPDPRDEESWRRFAKGRAEAQNIGLDRALEIVAEETGIEVEP